MILLFKNLSLIHILSKIPTRVNKRTNKRGPQVDGFLTFVKNGITDLNPIIRLQLSAARNDQCFPTSWALLILERSRYLLKIDPPIVRGQIKPNEAYRFYHLRSRSFDQDQKFFFLISNDTRFTM